MDEQAFWHAFADMSSVLAKVLLTLVRGEGSYLWDDGGRRYIDGTAGLWFANIGHGRVRIAEAAAQQMKQLASYSTFGDLSNQPAEQLCQRVAEMAPVPGSKVFLTSGGSESIDTATKMARRYWKLLGPPDR